MECQILFSGKNKKNIIHLSSGEYAQRVVKVNVMCSLNVSGISMTGMYFNPAMASGHTFGCHGTAAWEHFIVYWLGPFLGCYVATAVDSMIHIDVVESEKERQKKVS